MNYRAGTVTLAATSSSGSVTFSSALPSADYRVALGVTTTGAYVGPSHSLRVTSKTANGFTVEVRKHSDGSLLPLDFALTLDYIAIASN